MRATGTRRGLLAAAVALGLAVAAAPATASPEPFTGTAAVARPLGASPFPDHPYMSNAGANSMHGDGYASVTPLQPDLTDHASLSLIDELTRGVGAVR